MVAFPQKYHHASTVSIGSSNEGKRASGRELLELLKETLNASAGVDHQTVATSTPKAGLGLVENGVANHGEERPAKRQKRSQASSSRNVRLINGVTILAPSSSARHVVSLDFQITLVASQSLGEEDAEEVDDIYEDLVALLQNNTASMTPTALLARSELQVLPASPARRRQSRSKSQTPLLELAVVGSGKSLLSFNLEVADEQWDMMAGRLSPSSKQKSGFPTYWLDNLVTLTEAAQITTDQTHPRPSRYHVEPCASISWAPIDGKPEIKLLVTVDAFVDPNISLQAHLGFEARQAQHDADHRILDALFPPAPDIQRAIIEAPRRTSLRGFYESLSPAPALPLALQKAMQPSALQATLLPFQLRTVAWLCYREGMVLEGYDGRPDVAPVTSIWEALDLGSCGTFAYCRLTGEILAQDGTIRFGRSYQSAVNWRGVRGTLLSEEMGLGKTLEAIGVMMLHRHPLCPPPQKTIKDEATEISVEPSNSPFNGMREWNESAKLFVDTVGYATLVVTPANLLPQWIAEFAKHAPALRICVYKGWRSLAQRDKVSAPEEMKPDVNREAIMIIGDQGDMVSESDKQRLFIDFIRSKDVVLTTYDALAEDATVAKAIPPRSRRANVEYREGERPRSPLVMAKWWRVCMDEVQMQNDRVSAEMVSLIPREFSLAISGTPAKKGTSDLMQTLRFLRVPVIPDSPRLWDRLQEPLYRAAFAELFSQIAVRTTKADVKRELTIPSQTRMVIPIDLSKIEMHYYLETLDSCRQALHIDEVGQPSGVDWTLDVAELRQSLVRLRQICTHLQVGQLGRTQGQHDGGRFRINLGRELMTMEDALDKMLFDHQQNQFSVLRVKLAHSVRKAQLISLDEGDDLRLLKAGTIYANICAEAERGIALLQESTQVLRQVQRKERRARSVSRSSNVPDAAKVDDEDASDMNTDSDSDDGSERDPAVREHERQTRARRFAAKSMIRELMLILHQAKFFSGDIAHIKGDIDAENTFYASSDKLRSEILEVALSGARRGVRTVRSAITDFAMLEMEHSKHESGIHSKTIMENANELVDLLNDNAELLWNWRGKIVALLATPLEAPTVITSPVDPDEVPEKDHYQLALEAQGEIEAYLAAYASALADRREMLMEERSLLQRHEARLQGQIVPRVGLETVDGETALLLRQLTAEREAIMKARRNKKPLKAALLALNDVRNKAESSMEIQLALDHAAWLRQIVLKQGSHVEKLLKEVDGLRNSFNTRVSYFAALQVVSDSVQAPMIEKNLHADITKLSQSIDESELQLGRLVARTKYLQSLGSRQAQPDFRRDDCVICYGASEDRFGSLLGCGHAFCQSCLRRACRTQRQHKCPMCKTSIERRAISRFLFSEDTSTAAVLPEISTDPSFLDVDLKVDAGTMVAEEVVKENEMAELRQTLSRLRTMDEDRRADIAESDMISDFGTKINFLVKHLHYLATHEPEARHVVFSNWRDSLKIVATALTQNGIRFVSLDQNSRSKNVAEQFRKDTSISVFLLHAEKESSGLTLTAASMVHLLEPVLAHGYERQAIGRVDRLGQQHETTVFCYSTLDTVEARILARAVRNGDSIYLTEGTVEQAQIAPPAVKGGDASTGNDIDLLELLG